MSPTCRLALGRTGLAPRSLPDSGLRFPTGEGCEQLRTAAQLWAEGFTGEACGRPPSAGEETGSGAKNAPASRPELESQVH